jgi:anti-anti-sigma factor
MTLRDAELAVTARGKAWAVLSGRPVRQAVIRLPGEIDISNARQVRDALTRALDDGTAVLVADAAKTSYCGCSGVSALIGAHHQAAARGGQLRIVASPALLRMLTLTGADTGLDTYPTLTAALARATGP